MLCCTSLTIQTKMKMPQGVATALFAQKGFSGSKLMVYGVCSFSATKCGTKLKSFTFQHSSPPANKHTISDIQFFPETPCFCSWSGNHWSSFWQRKRDQFAGMESQLQVKGNIAGEKTSLLILIVDLLTQDWRGLKNGRVDSNLTRKKINLRLYQDIDMKPKAIPYDDQ